MSTETFKNDDRGYMTWSRDHDDGYVLTRRRGDYGIHVSRCQRIFWQESSDKLTSAEKVCSDDRHELERHALRVTKLKPVPCEDCGT